MSDELARYERIRTDTNGSEVCAMGDTPIEVALHIRAEHSEGPIWDAETARLWWVDITGERVHCFDPVSHRVDAWSVSGQPGGVIISAAGEPVVASPEGLAVLDEKTGQLDLRVPIEQDKPENRANDVTVDGHGRAWVGTMALDKRPRNAALYRVDGDRVTRMVDGLTISNGPAFDEERGRLYLADTGICIVDVFDLDTEAGTLSGRRRFLDFNDAQVWPDGMTVDDEGMFWVALGRAGAVHRYRADGVLDGVIEVPTMNPTSVIFGGADGGDLYITSSWFDLDTDSRANQGLAGAIFRCRPGVTGRPSPRYAGVAPVTAPLPEAHLDGRQPENG
ncbi:MAG: SMP-30/gluconolactonase/LRE family protein [Ktedonobacterales bacterium]